MDEPKREKEILDSAKKIMNSFFETLSNANIESDVFGLQRTNQTRLPKSKEKNSSFKEKILSNAPNHNQDYIIAEKKNW